MRGIVASFSTNYVTKLGTKGQRPSDEKEFREILENTLADSNLTNVRRPYASYMLCSSETDVRENNEYH